MKMIKVIDKYGVTNWIDKDKITAVVDNPNKGEDECIVKLIGDVWVHMKGTADHTMLFTIGT